MWFSRGPTPEFRVPFFGVLNPGRGVYRQAQGWSMGTNAAPPWAQLMLRAYERSVPLPQPWALFRFIDDGFMLHPAVDSEAVKQHLARMYPAGLPFTFDADCAKSGVSFLDILVVSMYPFSGKLLTHAHIPPPLSKLCKSTESIQSLRLL